MITKNLLYLLQYKIKTAILLNYFAKMGQMSMKNLNSAWQSWSKLQYWITQNLLNYFSNLEPKLIQKFFKNSKTIGLRIFMGGNNIVKQVVWCKTICVNYKCSMNNIWLNDIVKQVVWCKTICVHYKCLFVKIKMSGYDIEEQVVCCKTVCVVYTCFSVKIKQG